MKYLGVPNTLDILATKNYYDKYIVLSNKGELKVWDMCNAK